jgi:hypothetical protein
VGDGVTSQEEADKAKDNRELHVKGRCVIGRYGEEEESGDRFSKCRGAAELKSRIRVRNLI